MEGNGEGRAPWRRRRGLVGPVILIAIGVVFLLNNVGLLEWDVWWTLFTIWPVLLIAAGIDLIIGYRSPAGAIVSLVLIVTVFAAALWAASTGAGDRPGAQGVPISYPLDGATEADVRLSPSVARISLSALEDSALLADGRISVGNREALEREYEVEDGVAKLTLESAQVGSVNLGGFPGLFLWDLQINAETALDLDVDMGVGQSSIDLSGMIVTDVTIDVGVGQTTITLPEEASLDVRVSKGVGVIVIIIPDGVEARVRFDTGVVVRSVPSDFDRSGDSYYSSGYDDAEYRVDLDIDLGVGVVSVTQR